MKSDGKLDNTYKFLDCKLEVSESTCVIKIKPKKGSCINTLSLATMLKAVMMGDELRQMAGKFVPFEVFQVSLCILNKCKGSVEFQTEAKETFHIIKRKLEVCNKTRSNNCLGKLVNWLILFFLRFCDQIPSLSLFNFT